MPCCAFAAFLFGQLVLGFAVIKRAVLGRNAESERQTNAAVEWRLGEHGRSTPSKTLWRPRRLAMPLFALAALLEIALLFGAIYGVRAHLGHAHHEVVEAASVR